VELLIHPLGLSTAATSQLRVCSLWCAWTARLVGVARLAVREEGDLAAGNVEAIELVPLASADVLDEHERVIAGWVEDADRFQLLQRYKPEPYESVCDNSGCAAIKCSVSEGRPKKLPSIPQEFVRVTTGASKHPCVVGMIRVITCNYRHGQTSD
jgi:hypothetical protein